MSIPVCRRGDQGQARRNEGFHGGLIHVDSQDRFVFGTQGLQVVPPLIQRNDLQRTQNVSFSGGVVV